MGGSALDGEGLSALIVGGGAIGSALAESLLQRSALRQLVVLRRTCRGALDDPRVMAFSFDAERPETVSSAVGRIREALPRLHLVINTVGVLHRGELQPEKRLASVCTEQLMQSFAVNAALLPLLAQQLGPLLRHEQRAVFASLSARVGSIGDNRLGGWYSYRASKAAHNMLLRTIAREWQLTHRNAAIVALHPGTVISPLSAPFVSSGYKKTVRTPAECAASLLAVVDTLGPEDSGQFYDWQGNTIPW